MEIFMDLPMTWQACEVISCFDPCSLLHGNFHGFTIGMEKFEEININSFGLALYMEISVDLPVTG